MNDTSGSRNANPRAAITPIDSGRIFAIDDMGDTSGSMGGPHRAADALATVMEMAKRFGTQSPTILLRTDTVAREQEIVETLRENDLESVSYSDAVQDADMSLSSVERAVLKLKLERTVIDGHCRILVASRGALIEHAARARCIEVFV